MDKNNYEIEYEFERVKGFNIDPNSMNDETEFKRIMGFDFDPDKYEIRPDDGVRDRDEDEDDYNNGEYDDGVYERHVIYKKVPYKVEKEKTLVDEGLISTYNRSSIDGRVLTPEEYVKEQLYKENPSIDMDNIVVEIHSANDAIKEEELEDDKAGSKEVNYYNDDQVAYYYAYYVTTKKVPLVDNDIISEEEKIEVEEEPKVEKTEVSQEELKKYLDELKKVREQVNSIDDLEERNKIIDEAVKRVENASENIKSSTSRDDNVMFKTEIEEIDDTVKKIQSEQTKLRREYNKAQKEMRKIIDKQNDEMNGNLTDEEQNTLLEEYGKMKLEINEKSIKIKAMLDKQTSMIRSLNNKKKKLENLVELLSDYNISNDEYDKINGFMKKRVIVSGILRKKGLSEILDKPYSERTNEEKKEVEEAKKEIKEELARYISETSETDILNAVQVLYSVDETYKEEKKPRVIETSQEKIKTIKESSNLLPARIVGDFPKDFVYKPGPAPEDMISDELKPEDMMSYELKVVNGFNIDPTSMSKEAEFKRVMGFDFDPDKYEIRPDDGVRDNDDERDGYNSGEYDDGAYERYVILEKVPKEKEEVKEEKEIKYEYKRVKGFNIDPNSMNDEAEFKRIMGFDFDPDKYEIRPDDGVRDRDEDEDDYNNGEYDDGVYEKHVIYEKVPVEDKKPEEDEIPEEDKKPEEDEIPEKIDEEEVVENIDLESDLSDKITLFVDQNEDVYIRKAALERFKDRINIDSLDDPIRIDGALCYKIDEEDADYIIELSDNPVSPYVVDRVDFERELEIKEEVIDEPNNSYDEDTNNNSDDDVDDTDDYDDIDNYDDDGTKNYSDDDIDDTDDYDDEDTNDNSDDDIDDTDDYDDEDTRGIQEPIKGKPHVESILDKITDDLDIRRKDGDRYKASNIKVTKEFKNELQSGNYLYNIVHVGIAVLKLPFKLINKGVSTLRLGIRGKKAMEEVKKRLDNLSEEELEVLFTEYKGHQLKTDMNTQINPLVLDKLREYGLKKVEVLNNKVKDNYSKLFIFLGELRSVEKSIAKANKKDAKNLYEYRKKLFKAAADCINKIEDDRLEADNLLSSGVHGLEEDFKAVSTKLSYVGKRFAKIKKFDNSLQHKLGKFGQGLRDAQANGDSEKIVENFMGLESCYYDNTEVRGSIFGKRSVGTKYFTPISEQFDYRNDPFISDLLTTIVLATSAVSAVNAIRTNIANKTALREHQQSINSTNQANSQTMREVHQTGDNITGTGDKYVEGLNASVKQNHLTNADVRERGTLDNQFDTYANKHTWGFGDNYHAEDVENHIAFNNAYSSTESQLQTIAKQYADKSIDQITAIKKLSNVQAQSQTALNDAISKYANVTKQYAIENPQHDLTAVTGSMDYLASNPDAIIKMTEAGVSNLEEAAKLAGMSVEQAKAFTSLSDDTLTTLLNAGAAASLAGKVVRDMSNNAKKGKYKDARTAEIESMFDEYYNEDEKSEEKSK